MIYMAAIDDMAICKVGFSFDIENRLRQLQTGSPFQIRLVKTREGCPKLEKAIHRALRKLHVRGEWFKMTPEAAIIFDDTTIPLIVETPSGPKPYNYIAATREAMGLSKREMAEALGVNLATIYRLEAGQIKLSRRTEMAIESLAKARRKSVVA